MFKDKTIVVNSKSFKDEKIDNLGKINCFFGINGSGKSALATYIKQNSVNPFCFDTNYVENNILLEDSNENVIQGVKLKVGKQVTIEKQIKKIKNDIAQVEHDVDVQVKEINKNKNTLFGILSTELGEAQRQFKTNRIHQKVNAKGNPISALNKWIDEADLKSKTEFNNISEIEKEINEINNKINLLDTCLSGISTVNFKNLRSILAKVIIKPKTNLSQTVIKWLEQGMKLHNLNPNNSKEKEKCLFCGNEFDVNKTTTNILSIISSEYSDALNDLEYAENRINSIIDNIKKYPDKNIFSNIQKILDNVLSLINQKKKETNVVFEIGEDQTALFNSEYKETKNILENYKNKLSSLYEIKSKTEEYAKNWIGQQLANNTKTNNLKLEILKLTDEKNADIRKIGSLKKQILNLESQQSNLNGFLDICNRLFKNMGLRLKLELDNSQNGYLVKEVNNIPLRVSDLSEGEKRILAFIEFFYQMRSTEKEIRPDIDTIIIDDPITSLDVENSYEIIEMINELIKQVLSQEEITEVFIFTNSSQAFHDIGYNQKKVLRWVIKRDLNGNSHIQKLSKQDFLNRSDYYKQIFNEVAEFAFQSDEELEQENNALFYCNKARLLIESHAFANYNISNATSNRQNIGSLIEDYNIPKDKQADFKTDLDIINKNSHGFSLIDNSILNNDSNGMRIQKAVRDIIAILYCKDSHHVHCMIGSLINGNSNRKHKLEEWSKSWRE